MENVLIINGSPKGKKGNTANLLNLFLKGYSSVKNDLEIKHIELSKKNIKNCKGCFSCWSKTQGSCILDDDTNLIIKSYLDSDLIIWMTPIYHYSMTSFLKTFIERTLLLNQPFIEIEENESFHKNRFEKKINQKHIVISSCGFPTRDNFDILDLTFKKILKNNYRENIFCTMGSLLSVKELQNTLSWYTENIILAGKEFAHNSKFEEKTKTIIKKPLVEIEDYIKMTNLYWYKELEDTLKEGENNSPCYEYLKKMQLSFVSQNSAGIKDIIEFEFTDYKENYYFDIKNKECKLYCGKSSNYSTKIKISFEI